MQARLLALAFLALFLGSVAQAQTTANDGQIAIGDVDHVGLAVLDLDTTMNFFTQVLGYKLLGKDPSYPSAFVRNEHVMITLWQVANPDNAVAFDRRKNIGLHHMALRVGSFEDLDALHEKFKTVEGVKIEFAPEPLGDGPIKHMMIYEPGGIRLEFIHRPAS